MDEVKRLNSLASEAFELLRKLVAISEKGKSDPRHDRLSDVTGPMCVRRFRRRLIALTQLTGLGPLLETIAETGDLEMGEMMLRLITGAQVKIIKQDDLMKALTPKSFFEEEDDVSDRDA